MWIILFALLGGLALAVICCRLLSGESVVSGFRGYVEAGKLLAGILTVLLLVLLYLYERFGIVTVWYCVGCLILLLMVGAFVVTLAVRYSRLRRGGK